MTIARFFDWFQLAALTSLVYLAIRRAAALYARGVRFIVIDRRRTPAQVLCDLLLVIALPFWGYEIIAHTWPLPFYLVPPWLASQLTDTVAVKAVGALVWVAGIVIYGLALRAFGDSWRLGIDRERHGALVTDGIFARTRNPIYVSLDLFAIGTFLIQGRLIFLMLALVIVATLHEQIRREEGFLAEAYGDAYSGYCDRVGRYVTWRLTGDKL